MLVAANCQGIFINRGKIDTSHSANANRYKPLSRCTDWFASTGSNNSMLPERCYSEPSPSQENSIKRVVGLVYGRKAWKPKGNSESILLSVLLGDNSSEHLALKWTEAMHSPRRRRNVSSPCSGGNVKDKCEGDCVMICCRSQYMTICWSMTAHTPSRARGFLDLSQVWTPVLLTN